MCNRMLNGYETLESGLSVRGELEIILFEAGEDELRIGY